MSEFNTTTTPEDPIDVFVAGLASMMRESAQLVEIDVDIRQQAMEFHSINDYLEMLGALEEYPTSQAQNRVEWAENVAHRAFDEEHPDFDVLTDEERMMKQIIEIRDKNSRDSFEDRLVKARSLKDEAIELGIDKENADLWCYAGVTGAMDGCGIQLELFSTAEDTAFMNYLDALYERHIKEANVEPITYDRLMEIAERQL